MTKIKIKIKLAQSSEAIATARSLLGNSYELVKVIVSEKKWLDTFGTYDATTGGLVAKRRMDLDGVPVEFGEVDEAELVVAVDVEAVVAVEEQKKASKK